MVHHINVALVSICALIRPPLGRRLDQILQFLDLALLRKRNQRDNGLLLGLLNLVVQSKALDNKRICRLRDARHNVVFVLIGCYALAFFDRCALILLICIRDVKCFDGLLVPMQGAVSDFLG